MTKAMTSLLLCAALVGSTALAQDETETRSEREMEDVTRGVYQSPLSLGLRAGVWGFQDSTGDYDARGTLGINFLWNLSGAIAPRSKMLYGLETGLIYSHIGAPDANFVGTDSDLAGADTNAFSIPMNIAVGYNWSDRFLTALHGGAALIYRSNTNSMVLGRNDGSADDSVDVFPAIGANFGYSLSQNVGLSLRGDYIPTPVDDVYTVSLGATFGLI